MLHRYYNFSNGLLETQQNMKTDNFLMEFGPTLHCLITFGRLPPQTFHTMKNKTGQFSKSTSCIRKLGFGQSAFSRKINECHFTLIDIIIALISQFLVDAEHKSYIIYLKFHSIFFP